MTLPAMSHDVCTIRDALCELAEQTGDVLRALFHAPRQVDKKGRSDLVTDADRAAEAMIREGLRARFPGARLLLEEEGSLPGGAGTFAGYTFIVDPVDGTTNFAAGIPHFAVAIAAQSPEGELCAGVIHDPFRRETFHAARGEGAFLGSSRLYVSDTASLEDAVVATGFPYDRHLKADNNHAEFEVLNLRTRGARRGGASTLDLAWLAAGRFDAYWERGLKPWDAAAGVVLVTEAGGQVSRYDGTAFSLDEGEILATNGTLHGPMQTLLAEVRARHGFAGCDAQPMDPA